MIEKYIKKLSRLFNIEEPKIIYNETLGFGYRNKTLYLKKNLEFKKKLFLTIHEFRHYYQDLYIESNDDYLSNLWEYEMKNYDMNNYLSYHIELDAYAFSYLVLNYYFKIPYDLPIIIKENVLHFIEKNKYLYLFLFQV